MSSIKRNPKRKNNEILTTKPQQKIAKSQQKVAKSQQKVAKSQQKVAKIQQKVAKLEITKNLTSQKSLKLEKRKNTQNLTYEKPSNLSKLEMLAPRKPLKTIKQILSTERIEIIREKLKNYVINFQKVN